MRSVYFIELLVVIFFLRSRSFSFYKTICPALHYIFCGEPLHKKIPFRSGLGENLYFFSRTLSKFVKNNFLLIKFRRNEIFIDYRLHNLEKAPAERHINIVKPKDISSRWDFCIILILRDISLDFVKYEK